MMLFCRGRRRDGVFETRDWVGAYFPFPSSIIVIFFFNPRSNVPSRLSIRIHSLQYPPCINVWVYASQGAWLTLPPGRPEHFLNSHRAVRLRGGLHPLHRCSWWLIAISPITLPLRFINTHSSVNQRVCQVWWDALCPMRCDISVEWCPPRVFI